MPPALHYDAPSMVPPTAPPFVPPTAPPATGRVYTLDRQQSDRAPYLVRGTISIGGYDVDVLFDFRATHSFIATLIAVGLELPISMLSPPLRVTTTTGEKCDTSSVHRDVVFQWDGREFLVDLIVVMSPCDFPTGSSPYLSVLQAIKALRARALGYVMLGVLVRRTQEDITSIPVVREFLEVFLEDIPEFPPQQEIEFSIDLLPGVGPISLAPYQMSPPELAELKKHNEDLSAKNFIRPSVSP
ncbi:uncharacterized protein LOC133312149 [Gastrolobium bilobum]|uniref:uncharacterized protein LOC133312149 n=1 Tax=Gastrolobium bilobum TaxID=150636 RepID=UPI002AAF4605|nr:uncharacterized protein LOC133312149 [Gastrolobium bilobum]